MTLSSGSYSSDEEVVVVFVTSILLSGSKVLVVDVDGVDVLLLILLSGSKSVSKCLSTSLNSLNLIIIISSC